MNSALYECHVMHQRLAPKRHGFAYRLFYLQLDLDELEAVDQQLWLLSHNRWNLYSFRDRDHLDFGQPTLKANLLEYLQRQGVTLPQGARITLLTLPRVLGYIFNPVSFYFCYGPDNAPICAVAQVGNTFGEMKPYLLRERDETGRFLLRVPKHFYVSPFSELDLEFEFRLHPPGSRLNIQIDDFELGTDRKVLVSTLAGERRALTNAGLLWLTLKYPLITLKVIFLIHWHALLLWLRRVPWFAKADRPQDQRDVLHPHPSIAHRLP